MDYKLLADLLLPDVKNTIEDYEKAYPKRQLAANCRVTRFAPSPTGFQHLGGVFAALISERLAHESGGVFYLRIEDTDKKREVQGAVEDTINALRSFGIEFDEGMIDANNEKGSYGPYRQSERREIYRTYAKALIEKGLAYPCFCTEEEMQSTRKIQEELKIRTGYYGKWAKDRDISLEEVKQKLEEGRSFVIRLKSPGSEENRVVFRDLIKGNIVMPENDQDIVILKTDGIPTYHFAHAVDDYLMGTTHVIRGEEWLPSLPIHVQLFDVLGLAKPEYAHIPNIMKLEGSSKRKLSKRKDPEISISYYLELGYPFLSVEEYLLNLINSNFQDWRRENPLEDNRSFQIKLENMSQGGALFDILKLSNISKDVIANMNCDKVYDLYINWAKEYDSEMADLISRNPQYAKSIFNIERELEKPRKDLSKWSEIKDYIGYFYDELFKDNIINGYNFPENLPLTEVKLILKEYINIYNADDDKETWFLKIKDMSERLGYAKDMKAYKKNKEAYKGNIADVTTVIRVAVTNKIKTQDLFDVMQVLGKKRVINRLQQVI